MVINSIDIDFIKRNRENLKTLSQEVKNRAPRIRQNMDLAFNQRKHTPLSKSKSAISLLLKL